MTPNVTPNDPWLEANRRALAKLRAEVASWTGIETNQRYSLAERFRVDLDRRKELPSFREINVLAGHSLGPPPKGLVNLWASPQWWRNSRHWQDKKPADVPLLFRSKPGALVEQALEVVDATHLAAALRSLDDVPLWRTEAKKRAKVRAKKAEKLQDFADEFSWSEEMRREIEIKASPYRSPPACVIGDGPEIGIADEMLAISVGLHADDANNQAPFRVQRKFLVPTVQVLEASLGWKWVTLVKLIKDPAWIDLCPKFISMEGHPENRLEKAFKRASALD